MRAASKHKRGVPAASKRPSVDRALEDDKFIDRPRTSDPDLKRTVYPLSNHQTAVTELGDFWTLVRNPALQTVYGPQARSQLEGIEDTFDLGSPATGSNESDYSKER